MVRLVDQTLHRMTTPSSSAEAPHGAAPTPPALGNGKASAAPPKITGQNTVELDKMAPPEDKLPLHEDIMQLARLGEIGPIQTLFETGKFNAKYKDLEGITPLHVSQDIIPGTTRCAYKLPVGCNQQPLCALQIPCRVWRGDQCKRWRVRCYSCYVGCTTMPPLYRQPAS